MRFRGHGFKSRSYSWSNLFIIVIYSCQWRKLSLTITVFFTLLPVHDDMFSCFLHSKYYVKKYAHGFVVLCFVVVMQSFIMNSYEVFIHIHQGCFAGTGAIVRLPQCQWSKPDGYGKISQCITTTKNSKAKTVCIFLGIYCTSLIWYFGYILTPALIILYWAVSFCTQRIAY